MTLIDLDGLRARGINLSRTQLWRNINKGRFPAPIKVGEKTNAWIASEIDDWIEDLKRQRDQKEWRAG